MKEKVVLELPMHHLSGEQLVELYKEQGLSWKDVWAESKVMLLTKFVRIDTLDEYMKSLKSEVSAEEARILYVLEQLNDAENSADYDIIKKAEQEPTRTLEEVMASTGLKL